MSRARPERAVAPHPLAPFFRRRLAYLLRLMAPSERAIVRILPVLLGGRFRRPGYDKEPPGLARMPRRRRWGLACEAVELPPPLGFTCTRPLIHSVLVAPRPTGWDVIVFAIAERSQEDHRRLDERIQMLRQLCERRAPGLNVVVRSTGLPAEQLFFAGLAAGDVPQLPTQASIDPAEVVKAAPTPFARALALTLSSEEPFARLIPGIALASLERFAAAASSDDRLLPLVRQLSVEPGIVELELASRVLRHAAHLQWKRLTGAARKVIGAELKRSVMGSQLLPALRPLLEKVLEKHHATEVQDETGWHLKIDDHTLLSASTLDALRARALTETPKLCVAQGEWRRARALMDSKSPRTLFVIEPGFLKHLALTLGPTGRLRARRLTTEACLRLALSLRTAGRGIEVSVRPGASPLLVSRLGQIASADVAAGNGFGVQRGDRLLLAASKTIRDLPFLTAMSRPRRITLLPEHAEWVPALRPPRSVAGKPTVRATLYATQQNTVARALFVDHTGALFVEELSRGWLQPWIADTRALLEQHAGAAFQLSVSPSLESMGGRVSIEDTAPVELAIEIDASNRTIVTLGDDRFGVGQPLGWHALAETVFSHWPPQVRGRVRVATISMARQPADGSPLEVLAVRSRVLRRLSSHLASLAHRLEAA